MENYRLTKLADLDVAELYEAGVLNFGLQQAQKYFTGLHDSFELLGSGFVVGRKAEQFAKNLRRFEYGVHVIFYVPEDSGILVARVLGNEMDFKRHIDEPLK